MKGIKMSDEMNLRPFISHGYFYLGDLLYNDMGRKDDAVKTLKMAEGMFKEMRMDYYLDKAQKLLEKIQ